MLKQIKMVLGMNKALAELGINPNALNKTYRRGMHEMALSDGATAQEAATFIYYQLPAGSAPFSSELIVQAWISEGKVREDIVREAKIAASQIYT